MKSIILAGIVFAAPLVSFAATDYYLKIDGVDGEAEARASSSAKASVTNTVRSTTSVETKGNVEYEWKVEEGESVRDEEKGGTEDINIGVGELRNTGIEPDEIDFMGESENATNFGILLGGGNDDEGDQKEERAQGLERAREVLEENARASDQAIESVSLNFERITTRVRQEVRLFGLIPIEAEAEVDISEDETVSVRFPWWALFAVGKDSDALGQRVFETLSNVLKTKHDTIKNAISNVR